MNRRAFLKSIAAIGIAASIPAALLPAWKRHEPVLMFKGIPLRYDKHAQASRIFFINPKWPNWKVQ